MKVKIIFPLLIATLVLASCSSLNVSTDFDPTVDFSSYKTFKFYDGNKPEGETLGKNPLVQKRVEAAVKNVLTSKGFKYSEGDVDFVVILHAGNKERTQINTYGYGGYGYGRYGRNGWGYPRDTYTDVYQYTESTLFIDVADFDKKELTWRGTGTGVVKQYKDPEDMQDLIDSVVAKILDEFPPRK